jgi:hypothetical protein
MPIAAKLGSGLLHTRNVNAVETSAPTGNAGADVSDWDQVLVAVSGTPAGLADFQVWHRIAGFQNPNDPADVWVSDVLVQGVPIVNPNAAGFSQGLWVVNTHRSDRVQILLRALTTTTNAYIKLYGLTPKGGRPVPWAPASQSVSVVNDISFATGSKVQITDGTDDALVSGAKALYVGGEVAHDGADVGNPNKIGGKASTSEPAAVANGDRVDAYFDANGYQLVKPQGQAAEDAAVAGSPVLVGGRYDVTPRTLDDGDAGALALDAAGRGLSVASGDVAHDAADSGNPVKIGGKATTDVPALVANGDRVDASFTLDSQQRVIVGEGFEPVSGGQKGSGVDFTDAAAQLTAQMTVGTLYHLNATADCFIAAGTASVVATSSDYFLSRSDPPLPYRPTTGKDYISAIAPASGASGRLYASQAE